MRRLLIDSGGSSDDVLALLMAARSSEVEIVAVTAIAGCVRVGQAAENLLYGLEVAGASRVPVYLGCERPLLRPHTPFEPLHGRSGMGAHNHPRAKQRPESAHAVDAILSLCRHYRKELDIVCLGPPTNLAAALIQSPKLAEMPGRVYVYGGSSDGGNVTASAEFNFHTDPEAASLVLDSGLPITLVGWDQARQHMTMREGDIHRIRQGTTRECRLFMESTRTFAEYCRRTLRMRGSALGAVLTMAVALDPGVVRESVRVRADVETRGEITRGQVVFDAVGLSHRPANVQRVCDADGERAREMLFSALGAPPVTVGRPQQVPEMGESESPPQPPAEAETPDRTPQGSAEPVPVPDAPSDTTRD
ncbi:MAG: nucleoside hydrolase [Armatimonadota bacterium]|nr:nucleoside hydrolase [Armatimonadota bacterium]